jgi:hypothetical protein
LRNEISLPEPRFSIYKPGRESFASLSLVSGGTGASLAAEKAFRRRSSGFALAGSQRNIDTMDGITQALEKRSKSGPTFSHGQEASTTPVQPIPFDLYRKWKSPGDDSAQRPFDIQSPTSSKSSRPPTSQGSGSMSWTSDNTGMAGILGYDKLSKGDVGYGGNAFAGLSDGRQMSTEGLLAKKLRSLGVQSQQDRLDDM